MPPVSTVAAVVLAAGKSTRMGRDNKLLAPLGGAPVLQRVLDSVSASAVCHSVLVTGHDAGAVAPLAAGRMQQVVHNPDYADGLSGSLRRGLLALPGDCDAALIVLGDMPFVSSALLDQLIAAFEPRAGREICVPVHAGRRGNPVLWPRRLFGELSALRGDTGGRALLTAHASAVHELAAPDASIHRDIDSPSDLPQR